MSTGTRYFSPQTQTFSGLPSFAKSCPRAVRSDRAPRNLRRSSWRVTGEGRSAPSGGLVRGGVAVGRSSRLQYKLAASRSCRPAYIARDLQFPPFPTQSGPTGFPRRPHRTAVVKSRRQTPARTSRGTNQRVHAAREGLAARLQLPSPFPPCTTHDSRTSLSDSQPASRFTGPMPLRRTFPVLSKEFAPVHGAYPRRRELGVCRSARANVRVFGRPMPACKALLGSASARQQRQTIRFSVSRNPAFAPRNHNQTCPSTGSIYPKNPWSKIYGSKKISNFFGTRRPLGG